MRLAEEAERWGVLCGRARLLARRFWAGGLTLVVPYRGEGFAPRGVVTDMGVLRCVFLRMGCVVVVACVWRRDCGAERESFGLCECDESGATHAKEHATQYSPYPSQRREEQTPRRDTEQLKSTRQPKNDAQAT